jgi:hypothetical protein
MPAVVFNAYFQHLLVLAALLPVHLGDGADVPVD